MPIYEYRCDACGHQEEFLQKVSEPPLTECPACHKNALSKLLSAAGFQLKGSGWYATDFKSKPTKPPEKAAEGSKTEGTKTEGTKTEGRKTEAKTEAAAPAKSEAPSP